jgi:hypothetical protein
LKPEDLMPLLLELWKAAADCDNASRHVDTCAVMIDLRACSCGHDALVAVLKKLEELKP